MENEIEKIEKELFLKLLSFEMPKKKLGIGISYTFSICKLKEDLKVGEINIRLGESREMYYLGHLGYHIDKPHQGNNYAYKACLLLIPLITKLKVHSLVITTDNNNFPSKRICEKLGAVKEREVRVPYDLKEKFVMDKDKLRYIWKEPYLRMN